MKIDGRRCLVTGGAGFIGSHLVDHLLARDCSVVAVDDLSLGSKEKLADALENPAFTFQHLDILDRDRMAAIMQDIDVVFHLATRSVRVSLCQPSLVHQVNVEGTYNVLSLAAAKGVQKFLYCSSSEVNGTAGVVPMVEKYDYAPETIYGASKLAGEYYTQVFERSGWLNTVIARPHNNYGPRAHYKGLAGELIPRVILQARLGMPLTIYGNGEQTRDFTYVEETCEFLIRLAEEESCRGEIFNVCRGQEITVKQIIEKILTLTGSSSQVLKLPSRPSDVGRLLGDPSKLRIVLGTSPELSIDEGLRRTVSWYGENVPLSEETKRELVDTAWSDAPKERWLQDALSHRQS